MSLVGHEEKYATHPDEYCDSVMSRINHLKKEWRLLYKKLHSTGASVHPLDGDADPKLHAEIICEFPWFDDLNSVWGYSALFAPLVVSSQPGIDHAARFLSLVQQSSAAKRQSRADFKNERDILKLNIYRQEKEHQFTREENISARAEAAAAHLRSQQSADKLIRLRELEVMALQLKLRLYELGIDDDAAK